MALLGRKKVDVVSTFVAPELTGVDSNSPEPEETQEKSPVYPSEVVAKVLVAPAVNEPPVKQDWLKDWVEVASRHAIASKEVKLLFITVRFNLFN